MIPSGLQALMQASAVLQQQASQTAPGPQGQQPTVASQVMQQAQQAAQPPQMPQMQDVGRQAGLAGQLMAQQQQQQQQMAQNPQAIAQMAAQMLQQKGVAGLPTNMQFREGGIIGFSGEERSDVPDPEAGLSVAERAERRRRLKGSIYDPYFGLPPAIREAMRRDEEARREGVATPESIPIPGPAGTEDIPRARSEREAIEAEQRAREQRLQDVRELQQRREARRAGIAAALPQAQQAAALAGGEKALEEYYVPYPTQGPMRATTSRFAEPTPEPSTVRAGETDGQDARATRAPATPPPPTTDRPPTPARADVKEPSSAGIAAALPSTTPVPLSVTQPNYQKILDETPESPESVARRKELDKVRRERLSMAQSQEDLGTRGIEALTKAKKDREQLLESARSRDTYERLSALFTSLRTLGNEVGMTQRAIQAREEAAVSANLLHEEAVLKLKQAQQARALGLKDQEIQLLQAANADEQKAQELRRTDAKIKAEMAKSIYEAETREMTAARNRAEAVQLKLADIARDAEVRRDARELKRLEELRTRLSALTSSLPRVTDQIASSLKKDARFKNIESLESRLGMGLQLDATQQGLLRDFGTAKKNLEDQLLPPVRAQIDAIAKELGIELPTVPTTATGAVDFSKLPTKKP
jgi:hypothetical protein